MIGHLFASLVIEYTVFALIAVHMANILTIDHANLISVTRRSVRMNTILLDELEASRASRRRPWENLQEIRWVLKDVAGLELHME
jgi:hypothetical protein